MDEEYLRCSDSAEVDARKAGYRAYQDGLSRDDNPYNDWYLQIAWDEGWHDAAWDD